MGIEPILKRQPDFPKEYIGYAASAFYGGRTSAHVRKVPVPVVYTDFLSMYTTVNTLMDLWRFVIAGEIRVVKECANEIELFLQSLRTSERLFDPSTWKQLIGFVRVIPDGDILPCRSKYSVCGFRKFWHVNSGNSDTVSTRWQDLLEVEMTGSPRGSIQVDEASSFQDPIEDGCRHIFVV